MIAVLKTFLEISLTAAVMICLIWAFRAVFAKRINPMIIAVLWFAVLLRLCVPFTIESPIRAVDLIPQTVMSATQESNPMPVIDPAPAIVPDEIVGMDSTSGDTDTGIADTTKAEPTFIDHIGERLRRISFWNVLSVAWIVGAAGVLLWTLYQALLFKRKVNEGCDVTDAAILETVKAYKEKLGIKRPIRVRQCGCVDTPAIFGYFRPYLLLPVDSIREISGDALRHVLLHELCHIRRQDIFMGYLWLVTKALHWFNPFVWAAYRLYRDDVELCCDRMVIRHLNDGDPYSYSQTLIDVVRSSKRNTITAAASLCENKQKLKERVVRMLNPQKRSRFAVAVSLLLGLTILIGCFTTACQPKTGDILNIDPSDEIIYSDEYVAGQDSQYWYTNENYSSAQMADTEDGYYFMGGPYSAFLYYMDKATGESAPVCNKPECDHGYTYENESDWDSMDSECNAFWGPHSPKTFMYYGGSLYALGDEGRRQVLYKLSTDGDAPQKLRQLTADPYIQDIAVHREYVYYTVMVYDSMPQDETDRYQIYRLAVEDTDAEPELIYTLEEKRVHCGRLLCYGNYVYFCEGYRPEEFTDGGIQYLNRYNIKTGKTKTIQDVEWAWRYTIFNGQLAYSGPDGTYLCDLNGKHERRISEEWGALSSGGGYLLIDTIDEMSEDAQRWVYAYDGDGDFAGRVHLTDWAFSPDPFGVVDGLYFLPLRNTDTGLTTIYTMSVEKIADGTAVPEVFYEYMPGGF